MRRDLSHFWRLHLAVGVGVATTTAVLTGALLVGDSLRGSLADLTLDRLGSIQLALVNERFYPADLATRIASDESLQESGVVAAAVILLRGSATQDETQLRATGLQIVGVGGDFGALYPAQEESEWLDFGREPGQLFPSAIVNEALARELDLKVGDDLLISLGRPPSVPTASLMGRRDETDLLTTIRVTATRILPSQGPGRFGLEARQQRPLNLFVERSVLQRRLDRPDLVNLVLVGRSRAHPALPTSVAEAVLADNLEIADLGLRIESVDATVAVESTELVLRPELVAAIDRVAARHELPTWRYLTYLANTMRLGDRLLPYSTVAAVESPIPAAAGVLRSDSDETVGQLSDGEILVNEWAAEDLAVRPGDRIDLDYYLVGADDELETATAEFTVRDTVAMQSLGADPSLTPDVPGVSDAADMASWDPPFPIDLSLVRSRDEDYWDRFRGAPKAFVALETGQDLWRSRYGDLTSIRFSATPRVGREQVAEILRRELPSSIDPEMAGFRWLPVREQGLRGASGTTDFAGLFVGFSLFLIVSAALLVGLLFTLLVEQRCREAGLLLAVGYPIGRVRRRFLAEGGAIALFGVLLGTVLSLLYTTLVLRGLAVWWAPILDDPILRLHARPVSLVIGGVAAILLILLVIGLTVRRLAKIPARRLLAGSTAPATAAESRSRAPMLAGLALVAAVVLLVVALVRGIDTTPALFFGIGACLVIAGIFLFVTWARRAGGRVVTRYRWAIPRLAARNSSRNLGRSLLSVTLVASASFVLVSVSASRKTHGDVALSRSSGTGGFAFIAAAEVPLPRQLNELTAVLSEVNESGFGSAGSAYSLRFLPGDDASCLNLYQPERPRLLGVPPAFVDRGGFSFRSVLRDVENPWSLLYDEFTDGAIPVIGDYNSVRWILHSGLGRDLEMESANGDALKLRIVGLLDTSIFQSELLIAEEQFLRHFPDRHGYGYFLGEVSPDRLDSTRQSLENELARYGLDVESTTVRLSGFQAIENMYLTTFEVLGGLGLLLGTIGLGVVLLRNTIERRGELAVLRAFGYRRSTLARLVVAENAFLLVLGLVIGSGAGLTAVAPYLISGGIAVPWASLGAILLTVFLVGLLASVAAVATSVRVPLLPALKLE